MAGRRRRVTWDVASCLRDHLRTLDKMPVKDVTLQGALVWIETEAGERFEFGLRYLGDD